MNNNYVIGVDYGTDSVRAILVNAADGTEIAASIFEYPRWKKGLYCNAAKQQFRQHPLDYIEGLEFVIRDCLGTAGAEKAAQVRAISIDTTGSSPVAVDARGLPLALYRDFEDNPNAMFVLWKDHTAMQEAEHINAVVRKNGLPYLKYSGGIYSSEWFWAKLLSLMKVDEAVRSVASSFVEHCDWIPFLLCGGTDVKQMKRSACAAGHKAMWSEDWGGLPGSECLREIDPLLAGWRDKLYHEVQTADQPAGQLCAEWADRLGLPEGVLIGIGAFDAHMGAVGGQIEPYYLTKVMGTSTCDMLVVPAEEVSGMLVSGICGQVPGSIIPGMMGLEAGQSAFGDVFAWVTRLTGFEIPELSKLAMQLPLNEDDPLAVDWLNGRRTPDADQSLSATVAGLRLSTGPAELFKSMVEATCFGAKAIAERFESEGIPLKGLIGLGGVARKSPYIMQVLADVMGMPIRIHRSEQTCAAGAAMFAAVVGGVYTSVEQAMSAMGQGFDMEYTPDQSKAGHYQRRYINYKVLGGFSKNNTL